MNKIATILLFVSISICSASVQLRDPAYWANWNNIDLLNKYMSGFNFGVNQLQTDDYLTKFAQAIAETEGAEGTMRKLFQTYPKTTDNFIAFGITLRGNTTYKEILTEDYNAVLDGMSGGLYYKYKNNTMFVRVTDLKELMDLTKCDTLAVPLKCNNKAAENIWRAGTGEFKFRNDNYNYRVKFNNMLRVFESMADNRTDRYTFDLFKDTDYSFKFSNENYEMEYNGKNFFGPGFWSNKQTGVWGIGDQITTILTHGGNIRATSVVQHQYLKVHLEINEPFVTPVATSTRLSDADLREVFESHFKTMYEMYDREQVFNSLTKYGMGIALDSRHNIRITFALSGPVNNDVRVLERDRRMSLFNRLKQWPWFSPAPVTVNSNPWDRQTMISVWRQALGLSMISINQDRSADGLKALVEGDSSLTTLAQAAADKMATAGSFVSPDLTSAKPNTLIVAMKLGGSTMINEYAFLLNENNFGQVTCFDNFSNQRHKVYSLVESQRYGCSKNTKVVGALDNWKKYTVYGTGHSVNSNGDVFMAIALTY